MAPQISAQLENLLSGKTEAIDIDNTSGITRELIIEHANTLILTLCPGTWLRGEFLNKDTHDYLVYELHLAGSPNNTSFHALRILDFGDKFRVMRV